MIDTVTGAWLRSPAAFGFLSLTTTVMVGVADPPLPVDDELPPDDEPEAEPPEPDPFEPEADAEEVATLLMEEITAAVVLVFGRVTVTGSPTLTSACSEGSSATVTTGVK
ncbi:MAG: hypothetical protein ACRDK8_08075, partial [Solirubrobacteraceae bacterium]